MGLISVLIVLSGVYVGWALGANDGANCMGTAVGARVRSLREAVILVAVFGFLGSVTLGGRVIRTIGKGIVPLDRIDPSVAMRIALATMLAAGTWMVLATFLRLPVSTTHASVGAMAGAGLASGSVPVIWSRFADIFLAWVLTPLGAALMGILVYKALLRWLADSRLYSEQLIRGLLTVSGIYMAFSWGANDVANATGPIVGAGILTAKQAAVLGGAAIALGVGGWGYKVMETIGTRITNLGPLMAFAAEVAAALNVHLYTFWGVPVSTTHAIVGAVFGVGLANGRAAVNKRTVRDIVLAWAATPVASGVVSFAFYHLLAPVFNNRGI
jgi:PiT family inorganic phosphate transporter